MTIALLEEEKCERKTKQHVPRLARGSADMGFRDTTIEDPRQVFAWDGIFRSVVSVCSAIYITAPIHYKTIRSSDGVHGT